MTPKRGGRPLRWVALIAALSVLAAACAGNSESATGTASETIPATEGGDATTAPDETTPAGTDSTGGTATATGPADTYRLGIFQDPITDNPWADSDTCCNSVWNRYVLQTTYGFLYDLSFPGLEPRASLAAIDEVPEPVQEGDVWVARIPMKQDAKWSDGEPVTAHDVVFTWETAYEFCLTGNWVDMVSAARPHPNCAGEESEETGGGERIGVLSVEAEDDHTVKVTFNDRPGLAIWGAGNGMWNMFIFPRHFWEPIVEEARNADDPKQALLTASGEGAPALGPTVFQEHVPGSHAHTVRNPNHHETGETISSGGVDYEVGPFVENIDFTLYGSQDAAVLGLAAGEVDLLLNSLGMSAGLQDQVIDNPALAAVVNPQNGFRYLGFNLMREPMSDLAFRRAMAVIIDKEYISDNLLQGIPYPVYSAIPKGNVAWYDPEVEEEIKADEMGGASHQERVEEAVRILKEAGYSWEVEPHYDEKGNFVPGETLIGPDGEPVRQLELLSPTPAYDPFRATFGQQIAASALEMGIPVANLPTDFNRLIDITFDEVVDGELQYDMFVLGWQLGNPAFPTFMRSFFGEDNLTVRTGGNNNTGFVNEEFEELLDRFDEARSVEEAKPIMSEMQRIIGREKPYVLLFETGILEFYNEERIDLPFTELLGGIQTLDGMQAFVSVR